MTESDGVPRVADPLEEYLRSIGLRFFPTTTEEGERRITWAAPQYAGKVELPTQGFKFHVSASSNNALSILGRVVPELMDERISFKCVSTIEDVIRLNSGMFGLTQVGKCITVYPYRGGELLVDLATTLCELTSGFDAPDVPSDFRLGRSGCVYYRYGEIDVRAKNTAGTIADGDGVDFEDERDPRRPVPPWVDDPFLQNRDVTDDELKLPERFVLLDVLRQRGKGGVYRALELMNSPTSTASGPVWRRVIIKEAKRLGEITPLGVEARARLRWQYECLGRLRGGPFPEPYDYFCLGEDEYLVMEDLGGTSLEGILREAGRRLRYVQISSILRSLHKAIEIAHSQGIVIGDVSPDNIVCLSDGSVFLADLEDALGDGSPNVGEVGTPGFFPWRDSMQPRSTGIERDYYALGVTLYVMLAPRWFAQLSSTPGAFYEWWKRPRLRGNVPLELLEIIRLCAEEFEPRNVERIARLVKAVG